MILKLQDIFHDKNIYIRKFKLTLDTGKNILLKFGKEMYLLDIPHFIQSLRFSILLVE